MQTSKRSGFKITPSIKKEITNIIDARIREAHVTKEDFSELKNIVKDIGIKVGVLAEAQERTETKIEELAEAQKRTETRVEELAISQKELTEAQKRTELEIGKLAKGLNETRGEVGGLSRSMSYALENEVYRMLPNMLKKEYGVVLKDKLIREEVGGKEINILGKAKKNGREVLIVGEAKLRLDERRDKTDVFRELEEKVKAVKKEYNGANIIKILVTHYATKGFQKKAREQGIIVVQSFQW